MISKNDLLETEKKFYSSFSSYKNNSERFNRTKDYFNWITRMLNEVIDNGESEEVRQLLNKQQAALIFNFVQWLSKEHVYVKEFSTGWNAPLVKRVANFISTYKELKEQPKDEQTAKLSSIFKKVMDEQDFATLAYCCQMLQRDDVIDWKAIADSFNIENTTENPAPSTVTSETIEI